MKAKLLFSFLFIFFITNIFAQKQIFISPNLKEAIGQHRTVAIIPFRVSISYKRTPKNFDAEGNKADEKKSALNMQSGMLTYLLKKQEKYSVTFQDVARTNTLLKQAGVFDKLDEILPDSLCKILKVDAIINSTYTYEKTGSAGASIATAMVFGVASSTGSGSLTMQIYDGKDGNLLWRFYKEMDENVYSSGDEIMERMMRKISRNFPYERD